MHYFDVLWACFLAYAAVSFLWFARPWLGSPNKWHIGLMAFSYVMVVLALMMRRMGFAIASDAISLVGFLTGIFGIGTYWARYK